MRFPTNKLKQIQNRDNWQLTQVWIYEFIKYDNAMRTLVLGTSDELSTTVYQTQNFFS